MIPLLKHQNVKNNVYCHCCWLKLNGKMFHRRDTHARFHRVSESVTLCMVIRNNCDNSLGERPLSMYSTVKLPARLVASRLALEMNVLCSIPLRFAQFLYGSQRVSGQRSVVPHSTTLRLRFCDSSDCSVCTIFVIIRSIYSIR